MVSGRALAPDGAPSVRVGPVPPGCASASRLVAPDAGQTQTGENHTSAPLPWAAVSVESTPCGHGSLSLLCLCPPRAAAPTPAELLGGLGHLQRRCPGADLPEVQERGGWAAAVTPSPVQRLTPADAQLNPAPGPCPGQDTAGALLWARAACVRASLRGSASL